MAKNEPVDYAALSRAVESGDYVVSGPLEDGATLRMGRPAKGAQSAGKTPNLTVRVDPSIRGILQAIADDKGVKESEIVRQAVLEFIECHPVGELAPAVYTVEDNAGHVLSIHRTEQGAETALSVIAGAIGINKQLIER
ncbi:hypothetical protein [Mycobacterium sp. DL440]|uniref:hypothetical protein n=1 Tax=Mycobacterium sp. DL440 TaxID=2675523 RepID=UPI00142117E8|nr:hypothetical protein [Mycobacterium sp. DL440]